MNIPITLRWVHRGACRLITTLTLLAALSPLSDRVVHAADWPQWRGPAFNGSSPESGLPSELSLEKNLAWKSALSGTSGSTPIIHGDHVFVSTVDANKNLVLLCLNRKDGTRRWEHAVGVGTHAGQRNNMASPSPVTDGRRVIALFGTSEVAAFDMKGALLWNRNLGKDYGGKFSLMWIYGSSPMLHEGRLFIQVLQRNPRPADYTHAMDDKQERESYLLCLDPATGKEVWRHVRQTDSTKESQEAYTTPIPFKAAGRDELLVVGGDHVSGHNPKTGEEFWRARLYEKRDDWYRIVASPVAADGLIYSSGPKGQPLVAFRAGGKGDVTASHLVWSSREAHTDWSTPLIYQSKLFVLDGARKTVSAFDPRTGDKKWSGSLGVSEAVWSSPTGADGKLYLITERGTVFVLSAGEEFKILSRLDLGGDPVRSSLPVAHGHLFVRAGSTLYCFGNR